MRNRENLLQIHNVAIVFGPTSFWPERESQDVALTIVCQNQILEFVLQEKRTSFRIME